MKKPIIIITLVMLVSLPLAVVVGCQQQPEQTPPTTLTLSIHNIQLCSAVSDDGDYTVQPGATFERGDVVWLYFEVLGMTVKGVEGKFECWGKFKEMKIYDPNGSIIGTALDMGELYDTDMDKTPDFIWFYSWYETTTHHPTGQYTFEVIVSDELSGAIGTASANFTLQ
jgi:hypothetical protein